MDQSRDRFLQQMESDMDDPCARGHYLSETLNSGMERTLQDKYGALRPGMPESVVDFAYGQQYSHPGLALRDRDMATIAAFTALWAAINPLNAALEVFAQDDRS